MKKRVLLLEDYLNLRNSINENYNISSIDENSYDLDFIEESLIIAEADEVLNDIFEKDEDSGGLKKGLGKLVSFFRGDVKKIRTLGKELKDTSVKKITNKYETEDKKRELDKQVKDEKIDKEEAQQKKTDLATLQKDKEALIGDKITDIKAEMDEIVVKAGTDTAEKAASAVKTAASLAANREALKYIEDREEKTMIMQKVKDQTTKIKNLQTDIKTDLTDAKGSPAQTTPKGGTPADSGAKDEEIKQAKTAVDKAKGEYDKVKDGKDEAAKIDAEIKFKQAQQKVAKLEGNDDLYKGLGSDIGELMKKKQTTPSEPSSDNRSPENKLSDARGELTKAQRNLSDLENRISSTDKKIQDLKAGKFAKKDVQDPAAAIKKLEAEKARMEADLPDYKEDLKRVSDEASRAESEYYKSKGAPPRPATPPAPKKDDKPAVSNEKPATAPPPPPPPPPAASKNFTYKDVSGKTKYVTADDIDKAKEKVKKFNPSIDLSSVKQA